MDIGVCGIEATLQAILSESLVRAVESGCTHGAGGSLSRELT